MKVNHIQRVLQSWSGFNLIDRRLDYASTKQASYMKTHLVGILITWVCASTAMGQYDPEHVIGTLRTDGIIEPVAIMDESDDWMELDENAFSRLILLERVYEESLTYYAYPPLDSFRVLRASTPVMYWNDGFEAAGLISDCNVKNPESRCIERRREGLVLTWKDKPAVFTGSFQGKPIENFILLGRLKQWFATHEEERIARNQGRVPRNPVVRDSTTVQTVIWEASRPVLDQRFTYVKAVKKYPPNDCSTLYALLATEEDRNRLIFDSYSAQQCEGKGAGASHPLWVFSLNNRLFLMDISYGYEALEYAVHEVMGDTLVRIP